MDRVALARTHGVFNIVSGAWPLLGLRSFEAVLGPKVDVWLVRTVAGLLLASGATQLATARDAASVRQARLLGLGVAGTLPAVDLAYAPTGRISRMYLVDAACQLGWVAGWLRAPSR